MPSPPKDIPNAQNGFVNRFSDRTHSLSHSVRFAPVVQESLERDLETISSDEAVTDSDDDSDTPLTVSASAPTGSHEYFRRFSLVSASHGVPSSFVPTGNRIIPHTELNERPLSSRDHISREERRWVLEEERSLLRDSGLIPPKHPHEGPDDKRRGSIIAGLFHIPREEYHIEDDESVLESVHGAPTETTSLLGDSAQRYGGQDDPKLIQQKWDEAVKEGKIHTTWQREAKTIATYSVPLMVTFTLQYSLTVASIFTVGHMGTAELGGVSLAGMTANITGYAIYQGLATSLDTLCAQAYGSGHKKLVGLQMQRMTYFLWIVTIPIAIVWLLADKILLHIVPEPAVANLAGLYLRVVLAGAPGFAAFEAGKRFVQAQGLFSASLYVLLFCAPFNAFLNWFFVWKLDIGFVGAPMAVAITNNLMPLGLFIYVRFISKDGMKCWNGFTRQAWRNWGPMIKLALPGLIMLEAEFGVTVLAAQSVVVTIASIAFQLPFTLSIAASTRVANLIGATLADAAKLTTRVAFVGAAIVGVLNVSILFFPRHYLPLAFTSDPEVIDIFVDAFAALFNGILRGLGRQHFGGYVQLVSYYLVAMPISMGTAFDLGWQLLGLWSGVAIALGLVAIAEVLYLSRTDWERSVEEAKARNTLDA
ncbi:hypothetical protein H2203_002358 [Taxawa tesnikishii (nom. ined.)]|nr:hypothetical protein H2203_002358 [Dothideales sp. JES 119]